MRILQISSANAFGGGERHLVDLVRGLRERGHDVFVAVRPGSPLLSELPTVPSGNISTLPLRNSLDALSARALARLVRQHNVQIVHAHMARDYPLAAYASRRNRHCRLTVTRHVLFPLGRLHSLTLSKAARVIAVSRSVARGLVAQRLIPNERIAVIPNGIDISRFENVSRTDGTDFRRSCNIPADALLVGTVGELTPLKGHGEFLQAAAKISAVFPNAYFLIAGIDTAADAPILLALQKQIQESGLAQRCQILGWVENLSSLYAALDVFVSASYTESFGLAIAEAMLTGTPVVATNTEGAAEIIADEKNGSLVQVGNIDEIARAVIALLGDEAKRQRIAASGQERIKTNFSLDQMVDATENLYREITGS